MRTEYASVVDMSTIMPTFAAMMVHVAVAAVEFGLVAYLLAAGARRLGWPSPALPRSAAALPLGLAVLMLLPYILGLSWLLSLAAGVGAIAAFVVAGRRQEGAGWLSRWSRRAAIGAGALFSLFVMWEQADPARLAVDLMQNMQEWRDHEVAWQIDNDARAPKVGDVAPDFELQDADGNTTVKLSAFRGQRPVALVFGSYT